jgi:DNA-binding response OmpR family regulator
LLARLRTVIRRNNRAAEPGAAQEEEELGVGPLRIHPSAHVATLDDQPLKLTALEFDLLLCLARARGRVKTREQLINTVGERLYDSMDRAIDVHIWSLRRKLGDDPKSPRFIRTVRAVGYMLINPETG